MRWLPFLLLLGCPVEPKDVQDLNQGNQNAGPSPENQMPGGKPPGQPQNNGVNGGNGQGGNGNGQPAGNISGENAAGGSEQGGQPPTGEAGENIPSLPPNGENQEGTPANIQGDGAQVIDEGQIGDPNVPADAGMGDAAPKGEGNIAAEDGKHPTPNFENNGQAGTPPAGPASGDVLPMYQNLPQFSDLIDGETIAINLVVSGATSFDFEFVVKREGDGRVYPKVLHKESGAASPVTITAPSIIDEPVWLVITADKTGDGPTPDDLVGGPTEALSISGSDLSLEYSLAEDSEFLKNLPWFSQASDGPGLQGGM